MNLRPCKYCKTLVASPKGTSVFKPTVCETCAKKGLT